MLGGELIGERREGDAEDPQITLDGTRATAVPFGESERSATAAGLPAQRAGRLAAGRASSSAGGIEVALTSRRSRRHHRRAWITFVSSVIVWCPLDRFLRR
jgi:hypothetical protein